MPSLIQHTEVILRSVRCKTPDVLVAFSTGKDSLVTMEFCFRVFQRAQPVFWYVFEGMSFYERIIRWAEARYGCKVLRYPHPMRAQYAGAKYRHSDLFDCMRSDTGIEWVASGEKLTDSLQRRGMLSTCDDKAISASMRRVFPVAHWTDHQIKAWLKMNRFPQTETFRKPRPSANDRARYRLRRMSYRSSNSVTRKTI